MNVVQQLEQQRRAQEHAAAWRPFIQKWSEVLTGPARPADMPGHLRQMAREAAKIAAEEGFDVRRGAVPVGLGLAVVYDNHPWDGRAEGVELFRRGLAGLPDQPDVLAEAVYPGEGPDRGYTLALLVRAGSDRRWPVLGATYRAAQEAVLGRMFA